MTLFITPFWLEPPGLLRSNGKRPDPGWHVSCAMEFWQTIGVGCDLPRYLCYFSSRSSHSVMVLGVLHAGQVEGRKSVKYTHLAPTYLFQQIAIETSGGIGPRSRAFLRELGKCVALASGEARSTSHLLQRLSDSMAVKCGKCSYRPGRWGVLPVRKFLYC